MTQVTDNYQAASVVTPQAADRAAQLDRLMIAAQQELRRIAHRRMREEREGHTLQTTALVNEAYLRLRELKQIDWQDRGRFLVVAAGTMRRILVDRARAFRADKRGGDVLRGALDEQIPGAGCRPDPPRRFRRGHRPGSGVALLRGPRRGRDRRGAGAVAGHREAQVGAGPGLVVP